mgnify:FL=1
MSSDQKLISLVIPTYKGAKTLKDLIEELILTFKNHNIEIVVVNDCSPDSTHEEMEILIRKYPNKLTYLKFSKNYGEHSAVMAGLKNCEGEIVIIMDDDFQNPPQEALKLGAAAILEKIKHD